MTSQGRTLAADLQQKAPMLSVGMLTADLGRLDAELELIEREGVELVHVDVMDGAFCPMLTVGPPIVRAVRGSMLRDVHLMVDDPLRFVEPFVAAGADIFTFHVEGARQPRRVLNLLGTLRNANDADRGIVRGVAVNPSTALECLEPLLDDLDYILLLAIDPGWGGQTLGGPIGSRLQRVREMIRSTGRRILLGVDGGVTRDNLPQVAAMGADIVVSGSAIFDGGSPSKNSRFMINVLRRATP